MLLSSVVSLSQVLFSFQGGLMDLEYELLKEFDRVVGQYSQPANMPLNLNTDCYEEECTMIVPVTSPTVNVSGPIVKHENPLIMPVAEQSTIDPPHDMVIPGKTLKKNERGIPHFVSKIYEIVDDPNTDNVVYWGFAGRSFVVADVTIFCNVILPRYFKHSNFSSFIRQLNTYGFSKIDPDKWEFATEEFQRGKKNQLKYIKRRRSKNKMRLGSEKQDEQNHKALYSQMSNLSQRVEAVDNQVSAFANRMQLMELKYKKMACLLSKTIQNPGFIAELIQQKASAESKHGDQTHIPSQLKMANNLPMEDNPKPSSMSDHLLVNCTTVTPQTPNKPEIQVSVCMSAPSCGESSGSPPEPIGSVAEVALDPLEILDNELMKCEEIEGLASENCMFYFHELESMISVDDESNDNWVACMDAQPVDRKP